MPDPAPPSPSPPAAPRHRSHFNNWISAIGGVIALGALWLPPLLGYFTNPALARDDTRGSP